MNVQLVASYACPPDCRSGSSRRRNVGGYTRTCCCSSTTRSCNRNRIASVSSIGILGAAASAAVSTTIRTTAVTASRGASAISTHVRHSNQKSASNASQQWDASRCMQLARLQPQDSLVALWLGGMDTYWLWSEFIGFAVGLLATSVQCLL